MRARFRFAVRLLFILAISLVGALVANAINTPLPWMLGPLVAVSAVSMRKVRILGEIPSVPNRLRDWFVPIIGLMIGAQVTYDTVVQAGQWWPSLLLVVPFAFLALLVSYAFLRRFGGYDKPTAFFASSPGGAATAAIISEQFKGDPARTVVQHFARISLTVTLIPLVLSLYVGHSVGSASGTSMSAETTHLGLLDALLLVASAIASTFLAKRLRVPAAHLIGPLIVSAVLHGSGITAASVPAVIVNVTQLVIGASLGARFSEVDVRMLCYGAALSLPALAASMALAAIAGFIVSMLGINSAMVGFISFAPGGVAEMSLIAVSIDADPVFVACHHVLRILTAVLLFPLIYRFFFDRP